MSKQKFFCVSKPLEYKGYHGSIEYSAEDGVYFGKVQGIRFLILYAKKAIAELREDFQEAIGDYLASCQEYGDEPGKDGAELRCPNSLPKM